MNLCKKFVSRTAFSLKNLYSQIVHLFSLFTAFAKKGAAVVLMANADNGFDLIMEIEKILSDKYELGIWE